jgi:hypothetical protein
MEPECTPASAWIVGFVSFCRVGRRTILQAGSATFITRGPNVYPGQAVVAKAMDEANAVNPGVPVRITAEMMRHENASDWIHVGPGICHVCYEHKATRGVCTVPEHLILCRCCASSQCDICGYAKTD